MFALLCSFRKVIITQINNFPQLSQDDFQDDSGKVMTLIGCFYDEHLYSHFTMQKQTVDKIDDHVVYRFLLIYNPQDESNNQHYKTG